MVSAGRWIWVGAEAWRLFVAYAESKARAGDREAANLMLFVDSGGAA